MKKTKLYQKPCILLITAANPRVASKLANIMGKSISAWAKIIGITPAALIFKGMY